MPDDIMTEDMDRAEAALRTALEAVPTAYVPVEIIILVTLLRERLDPKDAIVAAYILGKNQSVQPASPSNAEFNTEVAREFGRRQALEEAAAVADARAREHRLRSQSPGNRCHPIGLMWVEVAVEAEHIANAIRQLIQSPSASAAAAPPGIGSAAADPSAFCLTAPALGPPFICGRCTRWTDNIWAYKGAWVCQDCKSKAEPPTQSPAASAAAAPPGAASPPTPPGSGEQTPG